MNIIKVDKKRVPVSLKAWMNLTKTSEEDQQIIIQKMKKDLSGGEKPGFNPYLKEEEIYFDQRWVFIVGIK